MVAVMKSLSEIINKLEMQGSSGDPQVLIKGIAMDSRRVQPGDLYACVPGFKVDGHDYAAAAVASGAAALVVERFLPLPVPQVKVASVRQALGPIAAVFYGHPSQQLELVGVTGTNGKTTITYLIEAIAKKEKKKVGIIGTLGSRIDGREIPGERTTPEATEIQQLLGEMVSAGVSVAVMEVSSHALDLGRVAGCEFDVGIFTNLTQDHLDYHKTMEEYLNAKSRLFAELQGKKQPKLSILNSDDPAFSKLSQVSAAPVVSYGIHNSADYRAESVEVTAEGVRFQIRFRGGLQDIRYATPGFFSVYNALAAFAWGVERGFAPQAVAEALAEIPGVPGRFESVRCGQPFQVIVDYAHTPDGLENVARTARDFTQGRLITIFGCGGDRDRGKRPLMGEAASRWSDFLIVTSDNPRTEDPDLIIKEVLTGVSGVDYVALRDRKEAIWTACRMAKPGDTLLIAGKGHETYQIFGTEVHPFDDREVAREALGGLGYA
ncbi:UDP-N-acetylmuramoyl-L-alanyl-D-glutamate--2,6-diaminopimelate ligase [Desulfosporosinus sp. PR]|uniref:UDP-N-acetylmuramoyl-L-alanyl-D-glutamate--2, 6-diaminopimelate ligase n=1 Tax=Candidatus Desulfosporosinus nitrosoreducens TaxID=3401928 RepID=UPI0027F5D44F|nr:UDP-N-acetylmuramoyl-L-alanyl-D-glutamate--2,6-diaminopimelate ligase [Desulfosporosinus sp. PR]